MPHLDALSPKRIALIKPSALGDIVHALPVLSALRRRFPDSHITWVVNRAYEPLIAGHPDLTETLPFDRGAFKPCSSPFQTPKLKRRSRHTLEIRTTDQAGNADETPATVRIKRKR